MNTKQVYNQQIARTKDRKHSYEFRLLSIAIFMQYQLILPEAEIGRIVFIVSMCILLIISFF